MKARKPALPIPEGPRFWSVNLGTDSEPDLYHFKMPRYTVACMLLGMSDSSKDVAAKTDGAYLKHGILMRSHAALVGAGWHNRGIELDTQAPAEMGAALADYGEEVLDELQDRLDFEQLTAMGEACDEEMRKRLGYVVRAAERAAFIAAEAEAAEAEAPQADAAEQSSSGR